MENNFLIFSIYFRREQWDSAAMTKGQFLTAVSREVRLGRAPIRVLIRALRLVPVEAPIYRVRGLSVEDSAAMILDVAYI